MGQVDYSVLKGKYQTLSISINKKDFVVPCYSMTGFGKVESEISNFALCCELKSVNNRYKDVRIRVPNIFSDLEISFRKIIAEKFKRGSFDLSVSYKKLQCDSAPISLDYEKINSFVSEVQSNVKGTAVNFSVESFMKSDFYKNNEQELDPVKNKVVELVKLASDKLILERSREGEILANEILTYTNLSKQGLKKVEDHASNFKIEAKERLLARIKDIKDDVTFDESRVSSEIAYSLEKMDISEELVRFSAHINEVENLIKSGGELGRRLDFLAQELNREINTIGSKSTNSEISSLVIDVKVYVEKIREQALNLE